MYNYIELLLKGKFSQVGLLEEEKFHELSRAFSDKCFSKHFEGKSFTIENLFMKFAKIFPLKTTCYVYGIKS